MKYKTSYNVEYSYQPHDNSTIITVTDSLTGDVNHKTLLPNTSEIEARMYAENIIDILNQGNVSKDLQREIHKIQVRHPGILHEDMLDFLTIFSMGAEKYELNNWLKPDGSKTSHKDMHASMFRHLACSSAGITHDEESGEDHLLHLITRAIMLYIRRKNGIIHPED